MTKALNGLYNTNLGYGGYNSYYRPEEKYLEEKLEAVVDKQGLLGDVWNGFKEITGLGYSQSDCESMLEKYKSGELSFEEAVEEIEKYESKQGAMTSLMSNIATGAAAIAVATATGGASLGFGFLGSFISGTPIGAAVKTTIGFVDRATNDVKGDALNGKNIAKDVISGALTGTTSAVSSGVGLGWKNGTHSIGTSIVNGAKCGLQCGALSGATTYTTDTIIDDRDFSLTELAQQTAFSSLVSGTVGGFVGGAMYGMAGMNNQVGELLRSTTKDIGTTIAMDSTTSSARKYLGTELKQLLT